MIHRFATRLLTVSLALGLACGGDKDDQPDAAAGTDAAGTPDAATVPADAATVPADTAMAFDAPVPDMGVPDVAVGTDVLPTGLGLGLPGDELYPEGIAVTRSGTFYVGSLREGLILRATPDTFLRARPFIPAGSNGLVAVLGVLAEEATSTLWACSSDMPQARLAGTAKTALKAFDMNTGAPKGSWEFPGGGRCNDLTVDSKGNVYATDSASPRLLRLARGAAALDVWLEGEVLAGYLNGITVDTKDRLYLVLSDAGGLIRIPVEADGRPGPKQTVTLSRKLSGPDGVEMIDDKTALVVENSYAISTIGIEEAAGQTTGTVTKIARVRRPTTVAIYGHAAYVVEGQLGSLNNPDAGGPPMLPFLVFRIELP